MVENLRQTDLIKIRVIRTGDLEQIEVFEGQDIPAHEAIGWTGVWVIFQDEETERLWKKFFHDYAIATSSGPHTIDSVRARIEMLKDESPQLFTRRRG